MIVIVYQRVFPDITLDRLRFSSLASKVWEDKPGVLHMKYQSINVLVSDPIAQRILALQKPRLVRLQ